MNDFCTFCACTSAQDDLLSYVSGDELCARCVWNGRTTCAHCTVNNHAELDCKAVSCLDLLLANHARIKGKDINEITYSNMMPQEDVECYAG